VLQLALGIRRRNAWHCLLGGFILAIAGTGALPAGAGAPWRGAVALHIAMLTLLILGAAFRDAAGRYLRTAGAVLVFLACVAMSFGGLAIETSRLPWWVVLYPPTLAALLASYGWLVGHRSSYLFAGAAWLVWVATSGWRGYAALRQVVTGLDPMALGLAVFVLAVLISLGKAGTLMRLRFMLGWLGIAPGGRVPGYSGEAIATED
jgi:hypothetical protein